MIVRVSRTTMRKKDKLPKMCLLLVLLLGEKVQKCIWDKLNVIEQLHK